MGLGFLMFVFLGGNSEFYLSLLNLRVEVDYISWALIILRL